MAGKDDDKKQAAKPAAVKPEKEKSEEDVRRLRVIAPAEGFRRAGVRWAGITEVNRDDFTDEQVEMLMAEPRLVVEEL